MQKYTDPRIRYTQVHSGAVSTILDVSGRFYETAFLPDDNPVLIYAKRFYSRANTNPDTLKAALAYHDHLVERMNNQGS